MADSKNDHNDQQESSRSQEIREMQPEEENDNENHVQPPPSKRASDEDSEDIDMTSIAMESQTPSEDVPMPKSILVNRTQDDDGDVRESQNSLEMYHSSDTGIYKFYKTHGKDLNHPNVAKAEAFIYMAIPPDGGYAWVILATAFLCQVITDGILFSIGVLLPHIARELSMSYKETALVASTQIGIYCFAAPLGSALINRFGFRPVAVVGALLSSVAVFIASCSQGTLMLVIFYGVITGSAMGMIWVSTSLIINYYFEKYRALVGGLASSGSGAGVILLSLLNTSLVKKVGWRNTARVHVALLILAGMLTFVYKEVKPTKVGHFVEYVSDDDTDGSDNSVEIASDRYSVYIMPIPEIMKSATSVVSSAKNIERRMTPLSYLDSEAAERSYIQRACPCLIRERQSATPDGKRYVISHDPLERSDIFYDGSPDYVRADTKDLSKIEDIEILPGKEDKARTINYTLSVIRPPEQPLQGEGGILWSPSKIKAAVNNLFDLQLLKLAEFRLLLLESFLFPMGFNIPFLFSASRAEIHEDFSKLLPVVIGLTSIVLRIFIGFVAYKIKFHSAYLSGAGMVMGGLVTLLSGFVGASNVFFQFVYVVCFGAGVACYSALRATVYVQVLGLEKLTNAFGFTSMLMGVGVFIGTNIAGILNDYFGGEWAAFAFSGTCMAIAGSLKLSLPRYVQYRRIQEAKKAQKKVRFARKKWWHKCFSK